MKIGSILYIEDNVYKISQLFMIIGEQKEKWILSRLFNREYSNPTLLKCSSDYEYQEISVKVVCE